MATEDLYRIYDPIGVGIVIVQADGRIRFANRTAAYILRIGREQLQSISTMEPSWQMVDKDSLPIPPLRQPGPMTFRTKAPIRDAVYGLLPSEDRPVIWITVSTDPVVDPRTGQVELVTISFVDITERKLTEEALLENEASLRGILRATPIGIGLVVERVFAWVSDSMTDLTGYSRHELVGHNARVIYPSDEEYERVGDLKYRQLASSGVGSVDTQFKRKDGRLIDIYLRSAYVDPNNPAAGTTFTAMDITQRKQAERRLLYSETRFKELADLLPQTVFEVDTEGRFTYVNQRGMEFIGLTQTDIDSGLEAVSLFDPEERDLMWNNFRRRLAGDSFESPDYVLIRRNGLRAIINVYATPIERDGKIVGLRGTAVDLTEKRRLEKFANRAQRLETAGRIAGQVAHDFNNLLGPLVAYPELIRGELPSEHPALPYLQDMDRAARQISEINQQLLTLGRRGHFTRQPLNLNDIARNEIAQLSETPATLNIVEQYDRDLLPINGSAAQLTRVVSNLVNNARDAMQDSGTITIRTTNIEIPETEGAIKRIPAGEYIHLSVSDGGQGIPPDIMPRIFDPFFTTKEADRQRGSGLGLSTVYAVIEDHDGYIDCRTEPGRGTTFDIYFPVARTPSNLIPEERIVGGDAHILVVDDDTTQREVAVSLLEKLGYRVASVASGEEAIGYLQKTKPDLAVIDMIMPDGIDGAETYRQALHVHPHLKAIIASGYVESDRVKTAIELGAGAFVRKPLTMRSVARAVREELDRVIPNRN